MVIGDAAHGMLPFYGQGLNAGFEDVRLLSETIENGQSLQSFSAMRQKDSKAMQRLSEGNWREMNGGELKLMYNLKRNIVRRLHRLFPKMFLPLYTMLAFTDVRYSRAVLIDTIYGRVITSIVISILTLTGFILFKLTR